jgi:hypothetical protein
MICKDLGISELLFELLYFMRCNMEGRYKPDPTDIKKRERE